METLQKNKNITIAVLPFQVSSDDSRIQNLFLGFTEDLITNFSKFIGISVIASYSTNRIKNVENQDQIDKLGADFLIFGSVRTVNENLRISIQLVNAENQSLVFGGRHNETLYSLLEAQDSIIQQIVTVLQEKIDYEILSHSYKKETIDLLAYENYLRGMSELKKGSATNDVKARDYFNAALKINPHYSLAYTGLSLSYFNFWSCLLWDRWEISQKGAHEYALKAIEIAPNDYIALGVLGRTYVYLEEFEKAEHHLRKSLRMNSNDTEHLLRVAFSLMFLGYANEAVLLYHKAIKLNPFHNYNYYAHGANYYLEIGDFKKSIALGKKVPSNVWTDFPAFKAAAYLQINDYENVWANWEIYLEQFKKAIYSGEKLIEAEALDWLIVVNPFKGSNYLTPLIDYIKSEKRIVDTKKQVPVSNTNKASFVLKGDVWEMLFNAETINLKDAKGYHDIHKLLCEPTKEFHCLDLMGAAVDERNSTASIDHKAKSQYLARIKELQLDIDEAEELHQLEKITALTEEYDSILDHLSQSLGLSGKTRKVGSTVEKARSAITWRIRSAIKKIEPLHPQLAKHLSKSINTGTFCSYKPEIAPNWTL